MCYTILPCGTPLVCCSREAACSGVTKPWSQHIHTHLCSSSVVTVVAAKLPANLSNWGGSSRPITGEGSAPPPIRGHLSLAHCVITACCSRDQRLIVTSLLVTSVLAASLYWSATPPPPPHLAPTRVAYAPRSFLGYFCLGVFSG